MEPTREHLADQLAAAAEEGGRQARNAGSEHGEAVQSGTRHEKTIESAVGQLTAELQALHVGRQLVVAKDLVEYHANIGCYNAYLTVDGGTEDVDIGALQVRVNFPRVELLACSDADDKLRVVWCTTVERDVEAAQCSIESKADHLYVRLPVKASERQPLGGLSSFSRVTPDELEVESYRSMGCRSCGHQLLRPSAADDQPVIDRVLPLPSTNWMDMFDFWGAGIGAFEHIPRDGIFAQQRRVFVGEADIMVHRSDLIPESTTETAVGSDSKPVDENGEPWRTVFCSKCQSVLGVSSTEDPETIRFHKHVITASSPAVADIFARYTIDSILSAKLLEMADSDGIFRFRLAPSLDSSSFVAPPAVFGPVPPTPPAFKLQLLSWETLVRHQGSDAFRRVLKVVFAPTSDAAHDVKKSACLSGHDHAHHKHDHAPALPTHEVSLAPETLRMIVKRLEASSRLLPPSLRSFSQMQVGYLFA